VLECHARLEEVLERRGLQLHLPRQNLAHVVPRLVLPDVLVELCCQLYGTFKHLLARGVVGRVCSRILDHVLEEERVQADPLDWPEEQCLQCGGVRGLSFFEDVASGRHVICFLERVG